MHIVSHTYGSCRAGPRLLVFGCIHGNEPCGYGGIQSVMQHLDDGQMILQSGSVTFVPVANPLAASQQIRYHDANLNRIFHPNDDGREEYRYADYLTGLCQSHDILLDIHSAQAPGPANVFQDYVDDTHTKLAKATGIGLVIQGRPDVYQESDAMDTCRYMHSLGKPSVLVECGQHDEPVAVDRATGVIANIMHHLGMIDSLPRLLSDEQLILRLTHRVCKEADGALVPGLTHCQSLESGSAIVVYDDGKSMIAKEDQYILFPRYGAGLGDEWFYLADRVV